MVECENLHRKMVDLQKVDAIIDRYQAQSSYLIGILQDIQAEFRYLPREALERVSQRMEIPLSRIWSVATFFRAFSLKPRGRNILTICMGTACHVRGAPNLVEEAKRVLGVGPGETTPDLEYTVETVNCLGCCALAPVVVLNERYHGGMTPRKLSSLLQGKKEG